MATESLTWSLCYQFSNTGSPTLSLWHWASDVNWYRLHKWKDNNFQTILTEYCLNPRRVSFSWMLILNAIHTMQNPISVLQWRVSRLATCTMMNVPPFSTWMLPIKLCPGIQPNPTPCNTPIMKISLAPLLDWLLISSTIKVNHKPEIWVMQSAPKISNLNLMVANKLIGSIE
jgi:hypothetical protein